MEVILRQCRSQSWTAAAADEMVAAGAGDRMKVPSPLRASSREIKLIKLELNRIIEFLPNYLNFGPTEIFRVGREDQF